MGVWIFFLEIGGVFFLLLLLIFFGAVTGPQELRLDAEVSR